MKQLTIEHLAAYLPYGVKVVPIYGGYGILEAENIEHILRSKTPPKMVLRHLSDLTKEIAHNGETFVPMERIRKRLVSDSYEHDDFEHDICFLMMEGACIGQHRHDIVTMLHSWHFDTFSLIESGLAIDINTIQE